MKKHIKLEWVYIAVLVISLILSIVTGVQIAGEVVNVRRNLSEQNMGMNAFVYGKYIDSYLTNRVELLNTMADCMQIIRICAAKLRDTVCHCIEQFHSIR